jgi:hypothetical protein
MKFLLGIIEIKMGWMDFETGFGVRWSYIFVGGWEVDLATMVLDGYL